ncbi:MAG TPA: OB-fold nucleic acid binding domain-containing protein [Candidatus Deferrimicrobiaceae bacterium]|nr:OB-fold nucleic acid binding domain-containing protein [Candidatus Deferrimicrobiaceae bacterium]
MPKAKFVKDIKEGEQVKDLFLVSNKAVLVSNTGKPYLNLSLRDRTGQVECRVWDRAEEIATRFERDDIVEASGSAIQYQGRIQLKVNDVRKVEGQADLADYLPVTRKGIEPLWEELQAMVGGIQDPDLSRLLRRIFPTPPKTETARRFRQAPGGKTMHHDYIGGLLEHTVSVASICRFLSGHYEGVDADLLTAGALLHDIGKVGELSYEGAFDYTDEGRLLGHLYMGAEWVGGECAQVAGFPPEKAVILKHMILSHHGELEYGSPKRPKTLEAILLHFVENMDSKANAFLEAVGELREGAAWTDYQRMFERYLFVGKKRK